MMLTDAEVKTYHLDGFLVLKNVLSSQDLHDLEMACNLPSLRREQERRGYQNKLVHVMELVTRHPKFREVLNNPRIIEPLRQLVGVNIELQHSKLATKPRAAERSRSYWHQDFLFFPHTNTDLVALTIAIDPINEDSGCLNVIPGSHKLGCLAHHQGDYFTGRITDLEQFDNHARITLIILESGDISFHHCLTVHGSGYNNSEHYRRMAVYQFRAADAYQLAAAIWPETGLLVSGKKSNIIRCSQENIRAWRMENFSYGNEYGNAYNQIGEFARIENDRFEL